MGTLNMAGMGNKTEILERMERREIKIMGLAYIRHKGHDSNKINK